MEIRNHQSNPSLSPPNSPAKSNNISVGKQFVNLFSKMRKNAQHKKIAADERSIYSRKFPPVGCDTVIGDLPLHGFQNLFFNDSEILEVGIVERKVKIEPHRQGEEKEIFAEFTKHGKAIIQQQGKRGCTAAAAQMLILDHQETPSYEDIVDCNLGEKDSIICSLDMAGLDSTEHTLLNFEGNVLQRLKELIEENGPAIVSINDEKIGGHVIIIDEISENLDRARIRDPYHGWEITITDKALLGRFDKQYVIQIAESLIEK